MSLPIAPAQVTSNLQTAADQVLLQIFAPAAVVLNSAADIVYISGRTGKYLEPASGKANWNFHAWRVMGCTRIERGITVSQRGVAVYQRGADNLQGRNAIHE